MTKANSEYHAREKRYLEITENWINGEFDSVAECVRYHHFKSKNFQKRVNEGDSKFIRFQSQNRFNENQEASLFHYLKRFDDMNMSSISKFVVEIVNYILKRDDFLTIFIKKNWFTRFFKRNSQLKKITQRFLDINKKNVNFEITLKKYFDKLQKFVNELNIQLDNMWNMNETSFRVDCVKARVVVTFDRNKRKKNVISNSNNRDYCTTVEIVK